MRIFLDANVLLSASHSGSAIHRLVIAACKRVTVVTSDVTCTEARKNLELKRPAWAETFEVLLKNIELVQATVFALPVTLAAKDVPVLCAAVRAESRYLVTGDKRDFGHLFGQSVHGVTIITPLNLAQVLVVNPRSE